MVVLFLQYRKDKEGREKESKREKGIMARGRGDKGKETKIPNHHPDLFVVLPAGRSCGLTYL